MKVGNKILNNNQSLMDNFSTGLVNEARASVKTGLAVNLVELEQQNLFIAIGQFLGPVAKR